MRRCAGNEVILLFCSEFFIGLLFCVLNEDRFFEWRFPTPQLSTHHDRPIPQKTGHIHCFPPQNHRMVWVGRGHEDHPVPSPCCGQERLSVEQVPSLWGCSVTGKEKLKVFSSHWLATAKWLEILVGLSTHLDGQHNAEALRKPHSRRWMQEEQGPLVSHYLVIPKNIWGFLSLRIFKAILFFIELKKMSNQFWKFINRNKCEVYKPTVGAGTLL